MRPRKRRRLAQILGWCILILIAAACQSGGQSTAEPTSIPTAAATATPARVPGVFFDDFSYAKQQDLINNGWIVRTAPGWPGVPNAVWGKSNVSFVDDADLPGNRLVRMTSSTNGSAARQTQFCHERKYLEGTYAARVHFTDAPVSGTDGDQIVQTFYLISPLEAPMNPDYSEIDFEYLPNGGWGSDTSLHMTTWETFSPEPNWQMDNSSDLSEGSYAGWRTLVVQVNHGQVKYYVDGVLRASQGGKYYPEVPMSINFNLWFIRDGLAQADDIREYVEDIDWVYYAEDQTLDPQQIDTQITQLRDTAVKFTDTVQPQNPPLMSPCNF
jgi:hypothetical protein